MKNYSRAYNRHKQHVKFIKRVENWFYSVSVYRENGKQEALKGKSHTFLKTTGRPCNCDSCTYLKYKRTPNHKVMKEAFKD